MFDIFAEVYPWTKALHIISMIAWMAGIFYLPRLFVYHSQTDNTPDMVNKFVIMEHKLYYYIMRPALYAMWAFGLICTFTPGIVDFESDIWFYIKLFLAILITIYHFYLGHLVSVFNKGGNTRSEIFYRYINEVPTILMIAIVIMVVVRPF